MNNLSTLAGRFGLSLAYSADGWLASRRTAKAWGARTAAGGAR